MIELEAWKCEITIHDLTRTVKLADAKHDTWDANLGITRNRTQTLHGENALKSCRWLTASYCKSETADDIQMLVFCRLDNREPLKANVLTHVWS